MSQSSRKDIFYLPELGEKKNGRRICPISDDLASTHTLGYPPKQPFYQARLPGCGQEVPPP